ncbi:TRAFAC clade GTPase domain-containing protein [Rhizobacter sp. P5_C2]
MTPQAITLVGVPDSGKTNYILRLWAALRARRSRLIAPTLPPVITFVEETLEHVLSGHFPPRSDKSEGEHRRDFVVPVILAREPQSDPIELLVPDVSGEVWKNAVETLEISAEWMEQLRRSSGALLFVRVLSEHNVAPLDWVNAEKYMRHLAPDAEAASRVPTQVVLCELLRFLESSLRPGNDGELPRVAIVVTAWDKLDAQRDLAGPAAYLREEFPLFAGMVRHADRLNVRVFGVSIVGGDFEDPVFTAEFLDHGELESSGFCVEQQGGAYVRSPDLTAPVAWLIDPHDANE